MSRAQELAKLIRQARKAAGLNGLNQQEVLKGIRAAFDLSNEELAIALGVRLDTVLAYLAPKTSKKSRVMPEADQLVLANILADAKRKK